MSRERDWLYQVPPSPGTRAASDQLWDDCPDHKGVRCTTLRLGASGPDAVELCFHANTTKARRIARTLDAYFEVTGTLELLADWAAREEGVA